MVHSSLIKQVLIGWIRNTWRRPKKQNQADSKGLRIRRSDVIWQQHKTKVFEEIAELLGLESADPNTPGWFSKKSTAIGNIFEKMSEKEKEELDEELAKIAGTGYSEATRRQ
jgi:hypothetical protein